MYSRIVACTYHPVLTAAASSSSPLRTARNRALDFPACKQASHRSSFVQRGTFVPRLSNSLPEIKCRPSERARSFVVYSMAADPPNILFVCLGNINRSPCAEGLFKHLLPKLANCSMPVVDSCGIGGHFAGSPPATKMQKAALDHGFDISGLRARQVHAEDFDKFDLIVAMDRENLEDLRRVCPPSHSYKLKLLLAYAPELGTEDVPDPYYVGGEGTTLEIIAKAMERLIRSEYHAFLKPPS